MGMYDFTRLDSAGIHSSLPRFVLKKKFQWLNITRSERSYTNQVCPSSARETAVSAESIHLLSDIAHLVLCSWLLLILYVFEALFNLFNPRQLVF